MNAMERVRDGGAKSHGRGSEGCSGLSPKPAFVGGVKDPLQECGDIARVVLGTDTGGWRGKGGGEITVILTILHRIPQRGCVLLGKAHDLLRVAVSNEIGL